MTKLSRLGAQLSRHAGIYAGGHVLTLVLGLVNLAVLTRLLPPSVFGQLAIFLVFAALLTILYNLVATQGTFMWVYGADEGDVGDGGGGYDAAPELMGGYERRRALTTGLILTALVSVAGSLVVAGYSEGIAKLLSGDPGDADLVRLAAASAALGALWRYTCNILRFEQRPVAYVVMFGIRPVLSLAIAIPLVATGAGASGVFIGLILGTAVAVVVELAATRRSYALAFLPRAVPTILLQGRWLAALILFQTLIFQGDLLLLSQYVDTDDLALYRVATRVAIVVPFMFSALSMAWGPLYKTTLAAAARQERGVQLGALVVTFVSFCFAWVILGLAVGADVLVRIAPSFYQPAAGLIPLLGLCVGLMGMNIVVFRVTSFPHRLAKLTIAYLICSLLFVPISIILMPALGAYGAALSIGIVGSLLTAFMLAFDRFSPSPIPIRYGRIGVAVALAALCYGMEWVLVGFAGSLYPVVAVASLLAFPILLVLSGVLPRSEAKALFRMMRSALGLGSAGDTAAEMLERVPARQREFLERVLDRGSVDEGLATELGMDAGELQREFVRALRRAGEIGAPGDADGKIGGYLLSDEPLGQRNAGAIRLWSEEVDPMELDELEQVCDQLRHARPGKTPMSSPR